MNLTELGASRFLRPFERRKLRRVEMAQTLAGSEPVNALKDLLAQQQIDAVLSITKPDGHPFAEISIQATWDTEHDWCTVITEDAGQQIIDTWRSKMIKITPVTSRRGVLNGFNLISKNGTEFLVSSAGGIEPNQALNSGISNPLIDISPYKPGTEAHRETIPLI